MRKLTAVAGAAVAMLALGACGASHATAPSATAPAAASRPASATAPTHGTPAPSAVPGEAGLPGFAVLSMSFVSDQQGWALGTVACGTSRCLALLGTTNGGTTWRTLTAPARTAGGIYDTCPQGSPCVAQIRFATPLTGYAYGPSLFTTSDGGRAWTPLPGVNTGSLETAGGTAVRVTSPYHGCAGGPYEVQSAPVGRASWAPLPAPPIEMICQPVLYRQGSRLVLVGYGNPAGGTRPTAQLDRSADGGRTWASGPDSCGGTDGYASGVALAPPDVLVLLCQHAAPGPGNIRGAAWVRVSVNGGASFGPDQIVPPEVALQSDSPLGYQLAAASSGRLLVVETEYGDQHASRVLLSQDGGRHWQATLTTPGSQPVLLVGYEDPLTGRLAQGDLVWTTRDGGQSWTADRF